MSHQVQVEIPDAGDIRPATQDTLVDVIENLSTELHDDLEVSNAFDIPHKRASISTPKKEERNRGNCRQEAEENRRRKISARVLDAYAVTF